jgi:hypothetical protein
MLSIAEVMKEKAMEIAEYAHEQIAGFDLQLALIEEEKAKINAEREQARGALKRAADFPVKSGADYLCPMCWVDDGVSSTLRPVPSPDRNDIFRCNKCHFEAVF